jgi:alpha-tubulin suppressor-like RCC1 family protein
MGGWLGYGHTQTIGDNEPPGSEGNVMESVSQLTIDSFSVCGLREGGTVKCWGAGDDILGYGNLVDIGDDEEARFAVDVDLGGVVEQLGGGPKCALMSDRAVRCWGKNDLGQLGRGDREPIGDDEDPVDASATELGGPASRLARGSSYAHMCALMQTGSVRCWGKNEAGELGLAHQESIGDNEPPTDAAPVRVLE